MLTTEQALKLATKHGLSLPADPKRQEDLARFVRDIYQEGLDHSVMRIDTKGRRKS